MIMGRSATYTKTPRDFTHMEVSENGQWATHKKKTLINRSGITEKNGERNKIEKKNNNKNLQQHAREP